MSADCEVNWTPWLCRNFLYFFSKPQRTFADFLPWF